MTEIDIDAIVRQLNEGAWLKVPVGKSSGLSSAEERFVYFKDGRYYFGQKSYDLREHQYFIVHDLIGEDAALRQCLLRWKYTEVEILPPRTVRPQGYI